jgi:Virulence-associated protein E
MTNSTTFKANTVVPRAAAGPITNDNTSATPAHDKDMARGFLARLDPDASKFTFQFFGDGAGTKAEIVHGTLDEVWPKVQALNTPARRCGAFVTINRTDFAGRKKDNIKKVRALFADADGNEQVLRCLKTLYECNVQPSRIVKSGGGLHFYFFADDIPLEQFSALQLALANKLGSDPAVSDLPRVMRLPGTLHLKDPANPRLVKLSRNKYPRWKLADLVATLGLSPAISVTKKTNGAANDNVLPNVFHGAKVPAAFAGLPKESLADGLGYDDTPLAWEPVAKECGFIGKALATGGKDYAQPMWNLTTLAATFLEDGHALAHKMGEQHVDYTAESTEALWERKNNERQNNKGLGWPSCNAIQAAGCGDCATCPHLAKDKSPLNLTHPVALVAALPDMDRPTQVTIAVFRDIDKSDKPKPTLANAVIAIKALGIEASYDLFHHRAKVTYNGESKTIHEGLLTDHTVSAARSLINNTYRIDCGDDNTLAAINELAWANAYDPVLDMLDDCQGKWDRVERLDTWVSVYLGVVDTPLNRAIGRLVLIAACRRARDPGGKFDFITVLEGPEGTNKSTAIRILAGDENFSDQSILGASDKEVQEQLEGIWMHENADLAGMRRAEVESIKAFASRQVDRARRAYGRVREDIPRRSVEWATTNNSEYLQSQTGNRRFWPLLTGKLNIEALRRDREQLLGEAATYEAAGASIGLDAFLWSEAGDAQEARRVPDPFEYHLDKIPATVMTDYIGTVTIIHRTVGGIEFAASSDLLTHVLEIPIAQQTSAHGQRLALSMIRAGWARKRVMIMGNQARGFGRALLPATGLTGPTSVTGPTGAGVTGPTRTGATGPTGTGVTGPSGRSNGTISSRITLASAA